MLRRLSLCLVLGGAACEVEVEGVPAGKLAVVGDVVLGPEDLAGVQSQLGPYAKLRFRGVEGEFALLEGLVVTELLAQEAIARGLGNDPRVRFAVLEEIASSTLRAELERRVPYEAVAAETATLRAYYDAHPDAFMRPERRSVQGVLFPKVQPAEQALEQLKLGLVDLAELGDVVSTPMQERNDAEFPRFHPLLFDSSIGPGEWLSEPVVIGESLLVGRVEAVEPAQPEAFDDPGVQERLVHAVRAPRLEAAKDAFLHELRDRYPMVAP